MSEQVSVSRDWLAKVRGFCNSLASACHDCFRERGTHYCEGCVSLRAKSIMSDIDRRTMFEERSVFEKRPRISDFAPEVLRAIAQAGRPCFAGEIRIHGVSRQYKNYILTRLVSNRMISMSIVDGHKAYGFPQKGNKKNKGNK